MAPASSFLRELSDELIPTEVQRALRNALQSKSESASEWAPDKLNAYCPRCGITAGPGTIAPIVTSATEPPAGCHHCRDNPPPWRRITRLAAYTHPLDGWIRNMKFNGSWSLASFFGQTLGQALLQQPASSSTDTHHTPEHTLEHTLVCPVPLHWFRRWQRGYNQSHLMAQTLANVCNNPNAPLLKRRRAASAQSRLSKTARAQNLRQAFSARPINRHKHHILLVDDVKTTGATLAACTRLLLKQGAISVDCAVAAVTDPPGLRSAPKPLPK
ncbi:MAG: ComF family protein [Algisphaera sp.]